MCFVKKKRNEKLFTYIASCNYFMKKEKKLWKILIPWAARIWKPTFYGIRNADCLKDCCLLPQGWRTHLVQPSPRTPVDRFNLQASGPPGLAWSGRTLQSLGCPVVSVLLFWFDSDHLCALRTPDFSNNFTIAALLRGSCYCLWSRSEEVKEKLLKEMTFCDSVASSGA